VPSPKATAHQLNRRIHTSTLIKAKMPPGTDAVVLLLRNNGATNIIHWSHTDHTLLNKQRFTAHAVFPV
jgi:hypothetical protein